MQTTHTKICHDNYRQQLRERGDRLRPGRRAELLIALERNGVLWEDLHPSASKRLNLPHQRDYGVDVVDDHSIAFASQVKDYGANSTVSHRSFSTFNTFSDLIDIPRAVRYLDVTQKAKIDSTVQFAIDKKKLAVLARHDFDHLTVKHDVHTAKNDTNTAEIDTDVTENDTQATQYVARNRPLRIPQREAVECVQAKPSGSTVRVQIPTGVGKTGVAMTLFIAEIQKKPSSVHLILVPQRPLAHQLRKEAEADWGIPVRFVGDVEGDSGAPASAAQGGYIIVCIYNSISKLPKDVQIGLKVIDEAHHVEDGAKRRRKQIDRVPCERTLMLSATFRDTSQLDYVYSIQDAIDNKFILDYKIHFGVYQEEICEGSSKKLLTRTKAAVTLVAQHIDSWRPALVFFNRTANCARAAELFEAQDIRVRHINGKTPSTEREAVKEMVENGELDVVCLCGLWNESVTVRAARTVVYADPRQSQVNQIQTASRANRLAAGKAFYRVVIPCCESDMENKNVQKCIQGFMQVDPRIAEAIEHKQSTRLQIEVVTMSENDENDEDNDDNNDAAIDMLYERIYDRMGRLLPNGEWFERLREVEAWMDAQVPVCRPHQKSVVTYEKGLAIWISRQLTNASSRKYAMSDDNVFKAWCDHTEKYKDMYIRDEEKWFSILAKVEAYIDVHKQRPSKCASVTAAERSLGNWIGAQLENAKSSPRRQVMLKCVVFEAWCAHVQKYQHIYSKKTRRLAPYAAQYNSPEECWFANLAKLEKWIDSQNWNYGKRPSFKSNTTHVGLWAQRQLSNEVVRKGIMQNDAIHTAWINHRKRYPLIYLTKDEVWHYHYSRLCEWMQLHRNSRPSTTSQCCEESFLGRWDGTQMKSYKTRTDAMKDPHKYKVWQNHLKQHTILYFTAKEKWFARLAELKQWIDTNGKVEPYPLPKSSNESEKNLHFWAKNQVQNAKKKRNMMVYTDIRAAWQKHVQQYTALYMTYKDKWFANLAKVNAWLEKYNRRPRTTATEKTELALGTWVANQISGFKHGRMPNDYIDTWQVHMQQHPEIYLSFVDNWFIMLEKTENWLQTNNFRRPTHRESASDEEIKIASWISNQQYSTKNGKRDKAMKNGNIYAAWKEHTLKYPEVYEYISRIDKWFVMLAKAQYWLRINKCRPTNKKKPKNANDAEEKKLANWISNQLYISRDGIRREAMKTDRIYKAWTEFKSEYAQYF